MAVAFEKQYRSDGDGDRMKRRRRYGLVGSAGARILINGVLIKFVELFSIYHVELT